VLEESCPISWAPLESTSTALDIDLNDDKFYKAAVDESVHADLYHNGLETWGDSVQRDYGINKQTTESHYDETSYGSVAEKTPASSPRASSPDNNQAYSSAPILSKGRYFRKARAWLIRALASFRVLHNANSRSSLAPS
jgi:hypothetical protein